ncbi:MAG: hypothetical protein RIC55_34195 [Pirellulaceae bacterium]
MFPSYEAAIFTTVTVIQVLAVASVVSVRLAVGVAEQTWCHRLFFVALLALGGITMATVFAGSGHWFSFAATLALMAVGGTLDLGQAGKAVI